MNKQKGFSQVFVMVVMLILAVALPITANLVKKVQDNRSSATINTTAAKSACTTSCKNIINGLNRATLPGLVLTFLTDWKPDSKCSDACGGIVAAVCVADDITENARKTTCNTTCSAATGLLGSFVCSDICNELISLTDCVPAKEGKPLVQRSQCSSTNCAACSTGNECTAQSGCRWGYYNSFLSCVKKDSQPTNPTNPTTPTNPHTEKWQTGAVGSGAKCTAAGGVCGDYTSIPVNGESCMVGGRIENGVIASGLCSGDTTVKCCKPSGSAPAPSTPTGCGEVRNQCDGNNLNHCDGKNWSLVTACPAGCDSSNNTCKDECTLGQTPTCPTSTTRQFCNKDADGGIRLKTETCPNGCEGGNCKAAPAAPDCSDAGNHCYGEAYKTGCTGTKLATDNNCASKANYCAGTYYGTYNGCGDSRGCLGTKDCKDPAYTAPKLNLYFAISGVKKLDSCFGDLKFNVTVTKDGSNTVTSREVTATVVDNRFNTNLGDQIFKISDFALTNDYALTDKIKITIGSNRKILATIYGKDSQNAGFPALNKSQILVSDLANKTLSLFDYPILNGDIGTQGSLGTQDKVVNGADFAFMKNEWGKTCKSGENLNADLNGDCRVDTFDLQILKNAMAEQYSQKTD